MEWIDSILVHNAVELKPQHFYYIDLDGNVCETPTYRVKWSIKERLQCFWIDVKRLFR